MSFDALARRWNTFFFAPQSPTPIALFRVLYGVLNIANIALMRRDWLTWFGPHGAVTAATVPAAMTPIIVRVNPVLDLLALLPQTNAAAMAFFWVFLIAALFVTLGFRTRLSSIVVYLCLMSIQARNPYITNGGDLLLRVTGFFLIFAPAGAALSVDRLIRIRTGHEGTAIAPRAPWAQRMIQIQVSIMYITTVWWKLLGTTWVNGTAVYYALGRPEVSRFPVPPLHNPLLVQLATWSALLIEASSGTLIWFRRLRYPVIVAALLLHIGIEYAINIPLFEWIVMATLVTFIEPDDLLRAWGRIRLRFASHAVAPAPRVRSTTPAAGKPVTISSHSAI
jgi:hypothetical protein